LKLRNGKNPPCYSVGVKEMREIAPSSHQEGKVVHTLGYPLDSKTFGGSWIYHFRQNRISLGFVTGLDYQNPYLDIHEEFQKFKEHPTIAKLLEGGRLISYGAKAIFEGGYFSIPKLYGDGFLLVGESAGFLNSGRLKGIHLAIKSGILAAETALTALIKEDSSETVLSNFEKNFRDSWAGKELWKVRNFHQSFQKGLHKGIFHLGLQMLTGGRGLYEQYSNRRDDEASLIIFCPFLN